MGIVESINQWDSPLFDRTGLINKLGIKVDDINEQNKDSVIRMRVDKTLANHFLIERGYSQEEIEEELREIGIDINLFLRSKLIVDANGSYFAFKDVKPLFGTFKKNYELFYFSGDDERLRESLRQKYSTLEEYELRRRDAHNHAMTHEAESKRNPYRRWVQIEHKREEEHRRENEWHWSDLFQPRLRRL